MTSNITGASFLANQIRNLLADTKKQLAQAGDDMTAAMADLQSTADEATKQVKIVQSETADLKAALGLSSNGPPPGPLPDHVTLIPPAVIPTITYETPPPFNGPAMPPYDDKGDVKTLQLANGETSPKKEI